MGKKIIYEKGENCITFCCRDTPRESSEVEITVGKGELKPVSDIIIFGMKIATHFKGLKEFKKI